MMSITTHPAAPMTADDLGGYVSEMTRLCASFPCLRGVPGTSPWDQLAFGRWASSGLSSGERQVAAFVLSVWNNRTLADGFWNEGEYQVGVFDPIEAMLIWDYATRAAYVGWCLKPFFP